MGKGYKHGGSGGALNFKVKTYPSETELKADKPRENTIGVITTTTMTSWVFSATEPKEPEVGMVWIITGTSSGNEFNALKNNALQVYLLSAKQYASNAFVDVPSYIYQDGEWKAIELVLFPVNGYTGEWVAKPYGSNAHNASDPPRATPTVSLSESAITVKLDTSGSQIYRMGSLFYDEPRNFKNRNTITVKYSLSIVKVDSEVSTGFVNLYVGKTMANGYGRLATLSLPAGTDKTATLSVSALGDVDGYIAFEMYSGWAKNTLTIKEFKIS